MRKLAVLLIVLSLVIPHVSATELTCQKTLPPEPSDMYCNLTGQGNISVRVVAFDGLKVEDYRYYGYWDYLTEDGQKRYLFTKLTKSVELKPGSRAEIHVHIGNVILDALYEIGLGPSEEWIFNGKRNHVTFEIIHSNGTVERKTVEVFIEGGPYVPFKEILWRFLFFALVLASIIASWLQRRFKGKPDENRWRLGYRPSRWKYLESLVVMWGLYLITPWVLYYLGTPVNYRGDLRLYISMVPLIPLTLLFALDWWDFKKGRRLHLLKTPPVTGVEWVPLSLGAFNGLHFLVGIVVFVLLFFLNLDEHLNRFMRLTGLVSPIWALYLVETFGGDAVFKYSLLALAVIHVALINWVVATAPESGEMSPEARAVLRKFEEAMR